MTNEEYHANRTHISKSGLDLINKSPAHFWHKYLNPDSEPEAPTEAMIIGTAIHSAVLEPNMFEKDYSFINDKEIIDQIGGKMPRSTNKYKEWLLGEQLERSGMIILNESDYQSCLRMRDKILSNTLCSELLSRGKSEQSFFYNDSLTGAPCKIRPDWISEMGYIVDIKSTEDASQMGFAKSVYNYRYHIQAPFYVDGYQEATQNWIDGFIFLAIEKNPPYNLAIYEVPDEIMRFGRDGYRKNLVTYMNCKQHDKWPGYPEDAQTLRLPNYVRIEID